MIGTPDLTALYARAISAHGGCYAERHDGEAAARGLALIGGARGVELTPGSTRCPLVAILRGVKPDEVAGDRRGAGDAQGIAIVEVPLNSPQPMESIATLAREFGDRLLIGAGTVMTAAQVAEIARAGGRLIVTPHADPAVMRAAKQHGLIAVPGFFTPAEAFAMLAAGADALKLFPAEARQPGGVARDAGRVAGGHGGAAGRRDRRGQHGGLARGRRRGVRHRVGDLQAGRHPGDVAAKAHGLVAALAK